MALPTSSVTSSDEFCEKPAFRVCWKFRLGKGASPPYVDKGPAASLSPWASPTSSASRSASGAMCNGWQTMAALATCKAQGIAAALAEVAELRARGVLTEVEFRDAKARILRDSD